MSKPLNLKYHHLGIPTTKPIEGEVYLKDYKVYHYGYEKSEYGIEWMRFEEGCNLPEMVKSTGLSSMVTLRLLSYRERKSDNLGQIN